MVVPVVQIPLEWTIAIPKPPPALLPGSQKLQRMLAWVKYFRSQYLLRLICLAFGITEPVNIVDRKLPALPFGTIARNSTRSSANRLA